MKVAIINTKQSGGGAAIASRNLFEALRQEGVDATFVVAEGNGGERVVVLSKTLIGKIKYTLNFICERFRIWINNGFSTKNLFAVSTADCGIDISTLPQIKEADIIHIHWINQGMLSVKNMCSLASLGKPMVITAHDMWHTTSICHHAANCQKYQTGCKECPQLHTPFKTDLSEKVWRQKNNLNKTPITYIALSHWIENKMSQSALTAHQKRVVIPNVINTRLYYPRQRELIRKQLGILPTQKVVIFGAAKLNDPIKGADLLFKAIEKSQNIANIVLLLFGTIKADDEFLKKLPCKYIYLGEITNKDEQAKLYSAADVAAVPSHYETLPFVIAEAMACGTPALAFDSAGQTSLIDHKENGYLAHYPSVEDFAEGLDWLLQNADTPMREKATEKIHSNMLPKRVAELHINLYKTLLTK